MKTVDSIVMKRIDEIKPYENNPRRNNKTVALLVRVIPVVGFNVPLVLDRNGVIVKGHARYLAAKTLGMTEVPCVISDADPEAIKADRIADNKVFEFSKWMDEELLHEVDSISLGLDFSEFGLPTMNMDDVPVPEIFDADDDEPDAEEASEEKKRAFMEMLEREAEKQTEITSQKAIDSARQLQREEVKAPPTYHTIQCEKCGHTMYIREGDEMIWE